MPVSPLSITSISLYLISCLIHPTWSSSARRFIYAASRQIHGCFDVARFSTFGILNESDCSLPETRGPLSDFSRFIRFACWFASAYLQIF